MKKIIVLLLAFCLLFATGCAEQQLISVPIFISRFNKISQEKIDEKNISAVEDGDTLIYSFLLRENTLITLRTQKDTGKTKQCTVTSQRNRFLNEQDFFATCAEVIRAYEKIDKVHAENILRAFSFKKSESSARDGFFRIDFLANDAAVFFSIESSRLCDEKVTDKKLYE